MIWYHWYVTYMICIWYVMQIESQYRNTVAIPSVHCVPMGHGPCHRMALPSCVLSSWSQIIPSPGHGLFSAMRAQDAFRWYSIAVLGWELLWAGKLHKALTWLMSHEQPCKEQTAKPDPWTDVQVRCPVCRKYIGKGLLFSQCAQEYQFVEILGEMGERVHRHLVDRCFAQCQPYLQ
jgi:hypothetical protein